MFVLYWKMRETIFLKNTFYKKIDLLHQEKPDM